MTFAAFPAVARLHLLAATNPVAVLAARLVIVALTGASWNTFVARSFSFKNGRAAYLSLKSIIDRSFGGRVALPGRKIVAP